MKHITLSLLVVLAFNANAAEINDVAEVVSTTPLTRQVNETRQHCVYEQVQETVQGNYQGQSNNRSYGGPIVGGVAGAILGNQVGGGSGKTAATVAGAIAGTMVGESMSNQPQQQSQPQTQYRTVQKCYPVTSTVTVNDGYDVAYRYNGKIGHTKMQSAPGQRVNVGISAHNQLY